jgi:hypothetical protein
VAIGLGHLAEFVAVQSPGEESELRRRAGRALTDSATNNTARAAT